MARQRFSTLLGIGLVGLVLFAALPSVYGRKYCPDEDDCGKCKGTNCPGKGSPPPPPPPPTCNGGCGCDKPLKDCDFFFHGHKDKVPTITLVRKGDNHIYVDCGHIVHQDGPDTRPVQTVNSAHCSLLSGGSWDQNRCGHHIYGNGRHIASRHFPSIQNPSHFLNACIKVQISAAQYKDGGNFNNGHSNPRACILVKTAGSFA
ncbi:hypothetical protein CBR_g51311 [Chara braunii]|uniref:Uncharacterized protein n=1 Tax=Chara braunii TaxID=69332 RepID=A0A388M8H1_CHABU|nr:hypothetical protein CBR_g51311 [Chara braunii]|eukprot:GBG90805.1 hypothetical protein CBR_g51311 [Chara braunii]